METGELKLKLEKIRVELCALHTTPDGDTGKAAFRGHCKEMTEAFTKICGGEVALPVCEEYLPQDSALARDILKLAGEPKLGAAMDAEAMATSMAILSLLQGLCDCELQRELALEPWQKKSEELSL